MKAPELLLGLDFVYQAFEELSSDRAVGMVIGPLPWSSVDRFCERHGIIGDFRDEFEQLLRAMDTAYLKYERERVKSNKAT